MADEGEMADIARSLLAATKAKKLNWESTSSDLGEFSTNTSKFAYYIRPRDGDGGPPYIFEVYARAQSRTTDVVISEFTTTTTPQVLYAFRSLYDAVRLSTFGIDSLKDAILGDVNELG